VTRPGSTLCILVALLGAGASARGDDPKSVALTPISGGDGAFQTVVVKGATVTRSEALDGGFAPYVYFRVPESVPKNLDAAYVELSYLDVGRGAMRLEFNGRDPVNAYRPADRAYSRFLGDTGKVRTAYFRLPKPDFRHGQNLGGDLRVVSPGREIPLHLVSARLFEAPTPGFLERDGDPLAQVRPGPIRDDVDATTLHRKVLCGYQGWFRCPGDPADQGWVHWSRRGDRIGPNTLTFEMWPALESPGYPATGFTMPDGKPALLFSSADRETVDTHFRWMKEYGVDGVFAQRFLVGVPDRSYDLVLAHVRAAAHATGRVFAVCYDLSGMRADAIVDRLTADWKRLVALKIPDDPRYLQHNGKPVLFVWGFYPDRFSADVANRVIDFLKTDGPRPVSLIGGTPWDWRSVRDPAWARVMRRFDVISPWNVGNTATEGGEKFASTRTWQGDLAESRRAGMELLPVIYPGFGWTNLKGPRSAGATIPRLGGAVYWRQFASVADLKLDMAYVAMFDEVDEGTAIFKVSNAPPSPGRFQTFEGLPSDWYLRLTGEGTKLLRGERPASREIPIKP
jgi:hypothetical protein